MSRPAILDSRLWLPVEELSVQEFLSIKSTLTLEHNISARFTGFETSKILQLYEFDKHSRLIGVPRQWGMAKYAQKFDIDDRRTINSAGKLTFKFPNNGKYRKGQKNWVDSIIAELRHNDLGTIGCALPGFGKTALAINIACELKLKTIVLVHKSFLMEQWIKAIKDTTGADAGVIWQDQCSWQNKSIVVAMVQSLVAREYDPAMKKSFSLLVADECHRMGAPSWIKASAQFPVQYCLGLSVDASMNVELRGGVFGDGWCGPIEEAYLKLVATGKITKIHNKYEVISVNNVVARGWTGKEFGWKPVKTILRHPYTDELVSIKAGGTDLKLTAEHSVYRLASRDKNLAVIQQCDASKLNPKDVLLYDTGWEGTINEDWLDVVDILAKNKIPRVHVAVDLNNHIRSCLNIGPKKWYAWNRGLYGTQVPLSLFFDHKDLFSCPKLLYTESASGTWVTPKVDLIKWAWLFGFWLGDGWVSGNRVSFAVETKRKDEVLNRLLDLPGVNWHPKIRRMPGKSVEIRCSQRLVKEIFLHIFGNVSAKTKEIPSNWIVSWPKAARKELLDGLLASDGCINVCSRNREQARYTTISKKLAYGVHATTRSLGIQSYVHKTPPCKGGVVNGRQITGKAIRYDVIWSASAMEGNNKSHYGARKKYHEYKIKTLEAPVRSIKTTKTSTPYVYDIEMGGHPSFVTNGILVHNSATPRRNDKMDNAFFWTIGGVAVRHTIHELKPKVYRVRFKTALTKRAWTNVWDGKQNLSKLLTQLGKIPERNKFITNEIVKMWKAGRKVLLLSHRKEHLARIKSSVDTVLSKDGNVNQTGYYVGGMTKGARQQSEKRKIILATFSMCSEGFDVPELDTLILATPASDIEQACGRILRKYKNKQHPVILDICDDVRLVIGQANKRLAFYTNKEFEVTNIGF